MMVHPSYVSYHLSLPPSPQILGVDLLRHTLQLQVTYARARLRLHTFVCRSQLQQRCSCRSYRNYTIKKQS